MFAVKNAFYGHFYLVLEAFLNNIFLNIFKSFSMFTIYILISFFSNLSVSNSHTKIFIKLKIKQPYIKKKKIILTIDSSVSTSASAIDALSAPSQPITANTNVQDNGVWLIVIVFGYIFGLFLIFVIIWFIWYGTSLKRRQHYNHRGTSSEAPFRQVHPSASGQQFSQYDYSTQSSLNRPLAQNAGFHLNQIGENSFSPMDLRTNPAFNGRDEFVQNMNIKQQNRQNSIKSGSINAHSINSSSNMQQIPSNQCQNHFAIPDEVASSHSTSFVHSYQHRV